MQSTEIIFVQIINCQLIRSNNQLLADPLTFKCCLTTKCKIQLIRIIIIIIPNIILYSKSFQLLLIFVQKPNNIETCKNSYQRKTKSVHVAGVVRKPQSAHSSHSTCMHNKVVRGCYKCYPLTLGFTQTVSFGISPRYRRQNQIKLFPTFSTLQNTKRIVQARY